MHTDGTVSIRVNGEHRRIAAGTTIAQLASELGLVPEKVAVERNLEIVPRSTLAQVVIDDGDDLAIMRGRLTTTAGPSRAAPSDQG